MIKATIIRTCQCCGYEEVELKSYRMSSQRAYWAKENGESDEWEICEVCASTYIANAVDYNKPWEDAAKSLAWIANHILKELRNGRQKA